MQNYFNPLQLLAPSLLIFIGIGLALMFARLRSRSEIGWMGLGFISFGCGFLVQVMGWPHRLSPFVMLLSNFHLIGVTLMAKALSLRLKVSMPWKSALALGAVLLALQFQFSAVSPDTQMRIYLFSFGAMALIGLPLLRWRSMRASNGYDRILKWAYLICIISYLLRTLILPPGIPYPDGSGELNSMTGNIANSWYWLLLHFFALATALALAVLMLLAVASDIFDGLRSKIHQDSLTNLLNRRGFYESVQKINTDGRGIKGALLICDIDHFKSVNDQWGHATGDQVLKAVAKLLKQSVRTNDLVARFGGEEFVVFLANSDMDHAAFVAERIRATLATKRLPMLNGKQLTLSIGVAELQKLNAAQLNRALRLADERLYEAKGRGRNQIAIKQRVHDDAGDET